MSGWYRMHRGWMDHPVFRDEEFSRRDAFQWIVQQAALKSTVVHAPSGQITIARGQLATSIRFMAKAWKWTDSRVRRFLKSTQDASIIDTATDAGQTVITVCNFDIYQGPSAKVDTPSEHEPTQRRTFADAKYKKEEKEEERRGRAQAPTSASSYAFSGKIVRLKAADLARWTEDFHAIPDLRAELASIDSWWQTQADDVRKSWFHRTCRMLNAKHQELLATKRQSEAGGTVHSIDDAFTRRLERFQATANG